MTHQELTLAPRKAEVGLQRPRKGVLPLDGQARPWLTPKMDPRADAAQIAHVRADLEAMLDAPSEPVKLLPRARDYYRVEDASGRRYWLFREGLYGDGRGGPPEWYVHGLFA